MSIGTREITRRRVLSSLFLLATWVAMFVFVGCSVGGGTQFSDQQVDLKIGTLPIVDTLPLYVADTEGFFTKQNLKVELVPFASALERDAAMASGQLDGQLNDLVSTALLDKDGVKVKVVRLAHRATKEMAQIAILVAPKNPAQGVADLKGQQIAISKNSVIEYVTDQLVASSGLKPDEVTTVDVSKIPLRLEMLSKGQIGAIVVPEPFISMAKKDGARVIADDRADLLSQSTIVFKQDIVAKNPSAIRSFLVAYEQAVAAINANPAKYQSLLVDRAHIPDVLRDSFPVPVYPTAAVPEEAQVNKVISWMVGKGLLSKPIAYDQLVDATLLPK